ncbi:MAG: GAF domain-containing SpoIIE family protein phosphatase [Phycisphaerae bacterium]
MTQDNSLNPPATPTGAIPYVAKLRLTDLIDPTTLQDVHDSLSVIANVKVSILDANDQALTQEAVSERFSTRSAQIYAARTKRGDAQLDQPFVAWIEAEGQRLAKIVLEPGKAAALRTAQINRLATRLNLSPEQIRSVLEAMSQEGVSQRAAVVQFMFLLAKALSQLCQQEIELRQRIQELEALFNVSSMITGSRGLQQILDRICRATAEAMGVKAASIRLLNEAKDELVLKAVFNLSEDYLRKGPVMVVKNNLDMLSGEVLYTADMAADDQVQYRDEARAEGIVSSLFTALIFKGHPIGVLRVYTSEVSDFTDFEKKMLKSIASQAAVAIETTRLEQESRDKERLEQQVQIAAEVQRRMMPAHPPKLPGFDIFAMYVPCFELGGDFYDFLPLGKHTVGLAVGDVSGKGIPASLKMASVRAAMRAHAENIYDLDQIVRKVNTSLALDLRDNEFITLWYGVLDTQLRRLTYCNAGHDPALVVRNGQIYELAVGGMLLSVDPEATYEKGIWDFQHGDLMLVYTDGLTDAMNFSDEKYGKPRLREALLNLARSNMPAEMICRQLLWETRRFVGLNRRNDDTTLVALRVQ